MALVEPYVPVRILNRFFLYVWGVAFFLQIGQNAYNNCIAVYANSLGYSNTFAGSLALPYLFGALAGRVLGGLLSDTRSRRLGMLLGCGSFLAGSVLYSIPPLAIPPVLMLARGMHGFGYACGSTAYSVAAVDVTPPDKLSMGLGINWTAQGFAQALGGVITAYLVIDGSYTSLFISADLFLILAVLCSLACSYERNRTPKAAPKTHPRPADLVEASAVPYAAVILVYYLGLALPCFYAVTLAVKKGFANGSLFFTACAAGMVLTNLLLVRLAKRVGNTAAMVPVFLSAIASVLLLAFGTQYASFLTAGVLFGIGIGGMPVLQSETVCHLPVYQRGGGTSTLFLAMDLSMGVGPVLWGMALDQLPYRLVCVLSVCVMGCAVVLLLRVFGRRVNPEA